MFHQQNDNLEAVLDFDRIERTGLSEAILCVRKEPRQIAEILQRFRERKLSCLLTRLEEGKWHQLPPELREELDYELLSRTAFFGNPAAQTRQTPVAIVSGGTSDAAVCAEAARTLSYYGVSSMLVQDVGVTGLWRLMERIDEIRQYPIVIAVAGMEGAIFSVLGGLVDAVLIAVPTSVSYGVGPNGQLALHAALGSCAPGIVTCNIDNGYGAACAALRIINRWEKAVTL